MTQIGFKMRRNRQRALGIRLLQHYLVCIRGDSLGSLMQNVQYCEELLDYTPSTENHTTKHGRMWQVLAQLQGRGYLQFEPSNDEEQQVLHKLNKLWGAYHG